MLEVATTPRVRGAKRAEPEPSQHALLARQLDSMYKIRWSKSTLDAEKKEKKEKKERKERRVGPRSGVDHGEEGDAFGAAGTKSRTKEEHVRAWQGNEETGLERVLHNPFLGYYTGAWTLDFAIEFTARRLRDTSTPAEAFAGELLARAAPVLAREEIGKTDASGMRLTAPLRGHKAGVPLHAFIRQTVNSFIPAGYPDAGLVGDAEVATVLRRAGFRYINDTVFRPDRVKTEMKLARKLKRRINQTPGASLRNTPGFQLSDYASDLTDAQQRALRLMMQVAHSGSGAGAILAGAAGSGKTRVTSSFLHAARSGEKMEWRLSVTVCAVTHKALSMSRDSLLRRYPKLKMDIDMDVLHFRTVASLLFSHPDTAARSADVLLVDEVSMVGAADAVALLNAFHNKPVLLVGDFVQLPSIAWGDAFYRLVRIAKRWRGGRGLVELDAVQRSAGGVLSLFSAVRGVIVAETEEERREGMRAVVAALRGEGVVVAAAGAERPGGPVDNARIAKLYLDALKRQSTARKCSLRDAQMHVQILCPNRDGRNSSRPNIIHLNAAVRVELVTAGVIDLDGDLTSKFADDPLAVATRMPLQVGEKVVVASNDGEGCLRRNDFGIFHELAPPDDKVVGDICSVIAKNEKHDNIPRDLLRPGHAETCHSYQGDEVEEVILAANAYSFPCDARLLYSGLTRAKSTVLLTDASVLLGLDRYCRDIWRPSVIM